jgi:hypothetical protein
MDTISPAVIQIIQAMLAPGLGISAVGLLLLGLNARYSTIINRIRLLNDEKRKFHRVFADGRSLEYADNARLMSVTKQSAELLIRSRLVRNAILSHQTAIGLFVLTSLSIGISLYTDAAILRDGALILFMLGMVAVLVGILFGASEVRRSFRIVLLEAKAEE